MVATDDSRTLPLIAAMALGMMLAACGVTSAPRVESAPRAAPETTERPGHPEQALQQSLEQSLEAAALAVAERATTEEKPCVVDVHVTQGGVVVSYAARGSSDNAAHRAVRHMAALHNRHQAESGRAELVPGSVRSLALVEDVSGGSRVTLIADDALDLADLYSHLAADAPDLMPSGSLERSFCQPPTPNSTATMR